MNTKTRFKLTVLAALFLGALATFATIHEMEVVATTCIAGLMTILSTYIWAQTKRPSFNEKYYPNNHQKEDMENHRIRIRSTAMPDGSVVPGENFNPEQRE